MSPRGGENFKVELEVEVEEEEEEEEAEEALTEEVGKIAESAIEVEEWNATTSKIEMINESILSLSDERSFL